MRHAILTALSSPDRAWIVILAGIVMIYREFVAPGRVLPGIFGAVAICVAGYALFQHHWHIYALAHIVLAALLIVLQGLRRWYWLPSIAAAALMTMGALHLTDPPISLFPSLASIPLALASGFLLHTALEARRRKRSV